MGPALLIAALLCASRSVADQPPLTIVDVGNFTANSRAYFVSDDGTVVAGLSANASFRWTGAEGMNSLGSLPGAENPVQARSGSRDGTVIVGLSENFDEAAEQSVTKIFRWTLAGGLVDLGAPPSSPGQDEQWDTGKLPRVSGDGQVIAAMSSGSGGSRVWRWTEADGWSDLGPPPSGILTGWAAGSALINDDGSVIVANANENGFVRWTLESGAWSQVDENLGDLAADISGDGNVVVGIRIGESENHIFRWSSGDGTADLGSAPSGLSNMDSTRLFVSRDGEVVIGSGLATDGVNEQAFRWSGVTGMLDLGMLEGDTGCNVAALSDDGSVVVGDSWQQDPDTHIEIAHHAFRWTIADGMESLGPLPGGATDAGATAISSDGSVVAGLTVRRIQPDLQVDVHAFRWTSAGMESLGALPTPVFPVDVNRNGSAVAAEGMFGDFLHEHSSDFSGKHPLRWDGDGGLQDIGLQPGDQSAQPDFISADGGVMVGTAKAHDEDIGGDHTYAFRWSGGSTTNLGALPGDTDSYIVTGEIHPGPDDSSGGGKCVSGDGAVVVGTSVFNDPGNATVSHAFLWTEEGGMSALGTLGGEGQSSFALAVSNDGTTVVGASAGNDEFGNFTYRAFRWTADDSMQDLGALPGTESAIAFFVSGDGSAVVGSSFNSDPNTGSRTGFQAFRWTGAGMVGLGTLPDDMGLDTYWPVSVSDDGSVILGMSDHHDSGGTDAVDNVTRRAFLWTAADGMHALPLELTHIHSFSLSGDGSIVAGARDGGSGRVACVWTQQFGVIDLVAYLAGLGLDMGGWNLQECGVSSDGGSIVGTHVVDGRIATFVVNGFHVVEPTNVVAWGFGDFGQTTLPVTLGTCTDVSAGIYYSMALRNDGTVMCWGRNDVGQCNVPAGLGQCKAISAGSYHAVALKQDGTVVCWGFNGLGQCDVPADLGPCKAIAGGRYHTVALKEDGTVVAWGAGTFSDGSFYHHGQSVVPADLGACKAIAAGGFHSMAIKTDGSVVAWGSGYQGAGHSAVPPELGLCKSIAAGFDHSLAVKIDGTVAAWGSDSDGQTDVPVELGVCSVVAAGAQHSMAIKQDGTVVAWGLNDYGEGSTPPGLQTCSAVAGGGYHSLALQAPVVVVLDPPTNVAASDGTSTSEVTVTWTGSPGAGSYQVFRDTGAGIIQIGAATSNLYHDTGAVPGTLGAYTVVAVQGAITSVPSAADMGYRNVSAPPLVDASDGTSTDQVQVSWPGVVGAGSYQVFRSDGGPAALVGTTPGPTPSYLDTSAVPGTLYTYTIKSVGMQAGVSDVSASSDTGFRQMSAPSGLAAADGLSTAAIDLHWNPSLGAVGYQIFRAAGADPAAQIASVAGTMYADAGAVPGVVYTYTVKAVGAVGVSVDSASDIGFRHVLPPTAVSASAGSSTSGIDLSWTAPLGANLTYQIFRGGVLLDTSSSTVYHDISAAIGVNLDYTVKAAYVINSVTYTSDASSPSVSGWRAPIAPTGLNASDGLFTTKVSVAWDAAPGATGYELSRDGAVIRTPAQQTTTSFDDVVQQGPSFSYTIRAWTPAGFGPMSAVETGFQNCAAPTGVNATDGAFTDKVVITWNAAANASGYQIFRSGTSGPIGSTSSELTFDDITTDAGTTHNYWVKAVTQAGLNSLPIIPSAASTINSGYRKVSAPANVNATSGLADKVVVTWDACNGATGYFIYRTSAGVTALAGTVTGNAVVTYNDTMATLGTLFTYTVKAQAPAGIGDAGPGHAGYRMAPPAGVTASDGVFPDKVFVSWGAATNATGYQIVRRVNAGDAGTVVATIVGGAVLSGSDTTADPSTTYIYSVRANSAAGLSPESSTDTGYRGTPPPTAVAASDGEFEASIRVQWSPVAGAAVTGYEILRNGVAIGSVSGGSSTTYIDFDTVAVAPNTTYTYTVKTLFGIGSKSLPSIGNTGWRGPAPKNVSASDALYSDRVNIAWDQMAGVTTYRVYRNGVQISPKITGGGSTVLAQDTTAVPGVVYSYAVRAVFTLGLGPVSNSDNGSRLGGTTDSLAGDESGSAGKGKKAGSAQAAKHGTGGSGDGAAQGSTGGAAGIGRHNADDGSPEQSPCDELFLRIADRIAAVQNALDKAISTNDDAAADADREVARAADRGSDAKPAAAADTAGALRDEIAALTRQLTLDEDQNGVLDVCQRAAGDVDLNGVVDDFDWVAFITAVESGDAGVADLNCDGEIDGADFGMLLLALPAPDTGDMGLGDLNGAALDAGGDAATQDAPTPAQN